LSNSQLVGEVSSADEFDMAMNSWERENEYQYFAYYDEKGRRLSSYDYAYHSVGGIVL
jgi:hypothetical protein